MSTPFFDRVVEDVPSLRAAFVTAMPDCLLFASWQAPESELEIEDVAAYFGDLVRSNRQGLKAMRSWSSEMQITIESAESLVLLREINADFVLGAIFERSAPLGMARLHLRRMIDRTSAQLPRATVEERPRGVRIVEFLDRYAPDPHAVLLRVALRTGLSLESLQAAESLSPEQVARLEEATCRLLGLKQLSLLDPRRPPMNRFNDLRSVLAGHDMTFLAGVPYVYHCHHYNLFHDQTIDDALGEDASAVVRQTAAHIASAELLRAVGSALDSNTGAERAALASELLAWMGHGRLDLSGHEARGAHLHYGFSWREKYGNRVKRSHPADVFAAGYAAAATEFVEGLPHGSLLAVEDRCVGLRDSDCHFRLQPAAPSPAPAPLDERAVAGLVPAPFGGVEEERIAAIAGGLRDFVKGVGGDDRGVIAAFGVFVTMHLSNYYNHTIYETVHQIEQRQPGMTSIAETLFREAGIQCVFNTFGNMLLSPEWEGLVGTPSGDPLELLASCCSIARGLGFGHWTIHEFTEGKRFVLRAPADYEVPFYLHRYGRSSKPRAYVLQGAALAMITLAHRVRWKERPKLTEELYVSLFRGKVAWSAEQTQCPTRGDAFCEVVVTAR